MTKIYAGIDPGQTGAVCLISEHGFLQKLLKFDSYDPLTILADAFLGNLERDFDPPNRLYSSNQLCVILEHVHAMPGQGVTSMFTFGVGYGRIQGWLHCKNQPFTFISPQSWQKHLPAAPTPKERVKAYCEKRWGLDRFMFPRCRVPHQGCMDAAAMADYGRLVAEGKLEPVVIRKPTKRMSPIKL